MDDITEGTIGYLVFPNPEGGDDDHHQYGRRVYADHPETADRFRVRFRFRDMDTGEVVIEGAATEFCRSIVEVKVPNPGPRQVPIKKFPGRITYFLGNEMQAQFVPANARGLIAFGDEKLKDRERVR